MFGRNEKLFKENKRINYYDYFHNARPSTIPLLLIAYHFFHKKDLSTEQLREYSSSDIQTKDFYAIRKWLLLSLLNHVFQSGNGWNPNTTGRKKIFEILCDNKGKDFPIDRIFMLYHDRLHSFNPKLENSEAYMNWYERSLVLYIMYGKDVSFRQNDVDHIHPYKILINAGIPLEMINSICNFQYLFYRDNRSKQDEEFGDWLNRIPQKEKEDFMKKHYIPNDPNCWYSANFNDFLDKRRNLIFKCIFNAINLDNK